jgi:translation initiation factor 2 beta subunit (eIF-2beta)/eIF-5
MRTLKRIAPTPATKRTEVYVRCPVCGWTSARVGIALRRTLPRRCEACGRDVCTYINNPEAAA